MKSIPSKLRVMADYGSSGIWAIEPTGPWRHVMVSHQQLKLPLDLASEFEQWISLYWRRVDNLSFDTESFNATGRTLAKKLKLFVGAAIYVEYQPELPEGGLAAGEEIT